MRGDARLGVDVRKAVVVEEEGIFAREVGEEEDFGGDVDLAKGKSHGRAGAKGIAVGADVGGDEHLFAGAEAIDDLLVWIRHASNLQQIRCLCLTVA